MRLKWIEQLGDWNPQLLREIKGRFKAKGLLIAGAISLLGQFFLVRSFQNRIAINSQLWWQELFVLLSLISVFTLLITGTYMLISDLAHEERRDTLNFIRLSPQPAHSILLGKLLGVPILLYISVGLAVPLHLWAGLSAQIPLGLILSFYGLLLGSCLFFYSVALLFGLVSSWLGGFQAWVGSGLALIVLDSAIFNPIAHNPLDWLKLFSPCLILPISPLLLFKSMAVTEFNFQSPVSEVTNLEWFYLPLGTTTLGVVVLALLNYGVWTYWSWQALKRWFPNPGKTVLSKRQSYLLVACFEVVIIGFAATSSKWPYSEDPTQLAFNFQSLLGYNLILFLGLIAALTPQRQVLQDWARYRRERISSRKVFFSHSLVQDLIWGEKSPAIVSIALNQAIAITFLLPWIVFKLQGIDRLQGCVSLIISFNLILIYAAIAQLLMFMQTQKQALWMIGTVSAVIVLPPVILRLLSLYPYNAAGLWLFTPFTWVVVEQASVPTIFLALLGQWIILTLSTLQVTRQLRRAGESASKALFASRSSTDVMTN